MANLFALSYYYLNACLDSISHFFLTGVNLSKRLLYCFHMCCMHASIYIYVVHISRTLFLVYLYESSSPGWMFENRSLKVLLSLLMSCQLSTSLLLHSLLLLLNILLHSLIPSCFLPLFIFGSPLSLPGCWSAALPSSLPLTASHLAGEAFPPRP